MIPIPNPCVLYDQGFEMKLERQCGEMVIRSKTRERLKRVISVDEGLSNGAFMGRAFVGFPLLLFFKFVLDL